MKIKIISSALLAFMCCSHLNAGDRFSKLDAYGTAVIDKSAIWSAIEDKNSNLTWQIKNTSEAQNKSNWQEAIEYCEELRLLGRDDWRLPNQNELKSLIDYDQSNPIINGTYFPFISEINYVWSSTSYNANEAWNLNVRTGLVFYNQKDNAFGVICVH